jgi:hypothetical protein
LPAEPASIDELRARIQIDWATLEDVVSRLSDTELTTPGPEVWSVQDHLAHIAEWERASTAVLQHRPQSEGFAIDQSQYDAIASQPDSIDRLNDLLFQRHRNESITDVKDFAARAHAELLAAVGELRDEDLRKSVGEFGMMTNPDRSLIEKVAGDSYEHYAEHATWITELLASIG